MPKRPLVLAAVVIAPLLAAWVAFAGGEHPAVSTNTSEGMRSLTCLGCHDGVLASSVRVGASMAAGHPTSGLARERRMGHQIGSDYALVQADPRRRLRPLRDVAPALKLEDGRVGCESCHDLASPRPAKLAVTRRGSVCLSCHDL